MKKFAIGLAVGVALTLAMTAAGVARDKEDDEAARKDVLDVLKAVEGGKDDKELAAKADAIKKKDYELNNLMKVYKLKEKGGLGFGPEETSGIEQRIIQLEKLPRGLSPATLKKEKKELVKLARLNLAMAEIARPWYDNFKDAGKKEGKTKKDWDKYVEDQKKASKDLLEAIEKEDGKAVSKIAKELLASCTDCHSGFRKP